MDVLKLKLRWAPRITLKGFVICASYSVKKLFYIPNLLEYALV